MKKKIIRTFVLILPILCSCNTGQPHYSLPVFDIVKPAEIELIGEEFDYWATDMLVDEEHIYMGAFDKLTANTLHVFDKLDGRHLRSGVKKGRSNVETLIGYRDITKVSDSLVYHDVMEKTRMAFSLTEFLEDTTFFYAEKKSKNLRMWDSYYTETPDGRDVLIRSKGYGSTDEIPLRSVTLREQGGKEFSYDLSPIDDPAKLFIMYTDPLVAISPDGSRLALSSSVGTIFETFDITDGVNELSTSYMCSPDFTVVDGTYVPDDRMIMGISDLCADDDRIYAVYDGVLTWKQSRSAVETGEVRKKNIALFDWKGKPQILLTTDYNIEDICVDALNSVIYACVETDSGYRLARVTL